MAKILEYIDAVNIRQSIKVAIMDHTMIEDPEALPYSSDIDKVAAYDSIANGEEYPAEVITPLYVQGRTVLWIERATTDGEPREWFYDLFFAKWQNWESVEDGNTTYITNRKGRIIDEFRRN